MIKIPRFFLSPIPGVGIRHASSTPLNIARNNTISNLQLPLTVHSHGGTPWRNHATWYFLTFPVLVHHLQDSCWLQPTGPTQWIYCRHWYKISKQWFNTILKYNNDTCIYLWHPSMISFFFELFSELPGCTLQMPELRKSDLMLVFPLCHILPLCPLIGHFDKRRLSDPPNNRL